MNAYIIENRIRGVLMEVRRARLRTFACVAAATALALVGVAGVVVATHTHSTEAVAASLVGWGGATCFAAWGGWAMRSVARLERRIVQLVAAP